MSITHDSALKSQLSRDVAQRMLIAARTAPKGKGRDTIIAALADEVGIQKIASHMHRMADEDRAGGFFHRDADSLLASQALVLLATRIEPLRLAPCGLCGFADCNEKDQHPDHPCAFNTGDLGIAIGSAVSTAADCRVDTRIMFSIGMAVRDVGLLGPEAKIIYGIPVSISGKSPFFDRNPKK